MIVDHAIAIAILDMRRARARFVREFWRGNPIYDVITLYFMRVQT